MVIERKVNVIDRSQLSNAFEFVTVASARAKQLLRGCTPRVESTAKPVRTAQREVITGRVRKVEEEPSR
ncbi:MAG: DNA-directed RNA polymerase subunit omega [Acidobacteria bacterium]|nr:DNA-directed RNA polymerase subunit omega [Acidobacteriota bacterium]